MNLFFRFPKNSFKQKLFRGILFVTIPLAALIIINSFYSISVFNQKIAESNQRTAEFSVNRIEQELQSIDSTLKKIVAGNNDFTILSGGTEPLQSHLSSLALYDQFKTVLPSYPLVSALFIYSDKSKVERDLFDSSYDYYKKTAIQTFVSDAVKQNTIRTNTGWVHKEINEAPYLFRFFGGRGTYVVAMISLEYIISLPDWDINADAVMAFTTNAHVPLTHLHFIRENEVELMGNYDSYYLSGTSNQIMVINRDISNTDCQLVYLVNNVGYFSSLNGMQIILFIVSILSICLIPLFINWMTRVLIRPLEHTKDTMARIEAGDLDAQMPTSGQVLELQLMHESFNSMMKQIKALKIETYEKELETQKAELRYLQLQIRPHFFLNCLKSIYAFAQQKQNQSLQKMILAFSKHIRYIFGDLLDFVPLENELNHVKNYVEIQAISSIRPPICEIDVDQSLLGFPIPPLTIQTFVENTIKHATNPDRQLRIDIRVSILHTDNMQFLDISVGDNGQGFSDSILPELNRIYVTNYSQDQIGIQNVKRRMQMSYGTDVQFAFFNRNIGSVSEVLIPYPKDPQSLKRMHSTHLLNSESQDEKSKETEKVEEYK